jgi:hypothetical protein
MYCTFNGKICLMMWDIIAEKYVYIPETTWYRLTEKARSRYTEEHTN